MTFLSSIRDRLVFLCTVSLINTEKNPDNYCRERTFPIFGMSVGANCFIHGYRNCYCNSVQKRNISYSINSSANITLHVHKSTMYVNGKDLLVVYYTDPPSWV